MSERPHEVALSQQEVDEILRHCADGPLLVGGQALAFWSVRYGIEPVGALSTKITSDVDFVGSVSQARKLGAALRWKVWVASIDDASGQTAKITKLVPGGGVKQIDYLRAIAGLDTARIQARAVLVSLPSGATIRILHPLDVLESRLRNLERLASKQNVVGIAQAELAIAVAGKFINDLIDSRADKRTLFSAVERIGKIARDKGLIRVLVDYQLDPLLAVPVARIDSAAFRSKRWSQIRTEVADLRQKYERKAARAKSRES